MQTLAALFALTLLFSPIGQSSEESLQKGNSPLEVVDYLDVHSYTGKWYEVARLPQRFQRKCAGTRVFYELDHRGRLEVLNTCQDVDDFERLREAKGLAKIVDEQTNAKLKVSFVPIFRRLGWFGGDYWVIALDDNYQYAMIGTPARNSLWIISRTPRLDEKTLEKLIGQAQRQGFDTTDLIFTPEWEY